MRKRPNLTTTALCQRLQTEFPFRHYFYLGLDAQAHTLDEVRAVLPEGGTILDIGCGPLDKTALLAWAGYECHAIDDFTDPWHREGKNLQKIQKFAKDNGIALTVGDGVSLPYKPKTFDAVMLNDVLEHLHSSPRALLNAAINLLKPGGYLMISVPNAVNLRKRIDVLRGKSNLPPFAMYYWTDGAWRGHVREYVRDDLAQLGRYAGLETVKLESCHHMLGVLPKLFQPVYKALTTVFTGWRDSWQYIGRRPEKWQPLVSVAEAKRFGLDFKQDFTR